VEEKYKSKPLSKTPPENKKRLKVTEEKIRKLIHHVENENMSVLAASVKANITATTGAKYYKKIQRKSKAKSIGTARKSIDTSNSDIYSTRNKKADWIYRR
jgi:hypothetical protein